MDIKQLLTMITLSQTFNYQKAAEQLQYAPSTLFKHIQMLEQEVGAPLFGKTGRQLRADSAGQGVPRSREANGGGILSGSGQRMRRGKAGGNDYRRRL